MDIEKCFDTIDHELLIKLLNEEIADGRVLRLIRSFLEAGIMEEMDVKHTITGTPQGGVISPLLANIYLHPLFEAMTKEGISDYSCMQMILWSYLGQGRRRSKP